MDSFNNGNADCLRARDLLDAYLSHELTSVDVEGLNVHLDNCVRCLNESDVRQHIKWQLRSIVSREKVPGALRRKVSRMLRGACSSGLPVFFWGDLE